MSRVLRSSKWFSGDDEIALEHRAAMHASGFPIEADNQKPIIGLLSSISDLNPCNLPLASMVEAARAAIELAGGVAVVLPTMSLGEDLMKPTAMLYRNLLAMEVEEYIRSSPLDGVVLFGNCDKTLPGQLMGAASANLPTVQVAGGYRTPGDFRGQQAGAGTDLWKFWDERRAGRLSDTEWKGLERAMGCSQGACNVMGTATCMAIISETLGLMVPGGSTIPVGDARQLEAARESGRRIVGMVREGITPSQLLTREAFARAVRVLAAIGGSTNAILHLTAVAGRVGVELDLREFDAASSSSPVIADVAPIGRHHVSAFDAAGGLAAVLESLGEEPTGPSAVAGSDDVPPARVIRELSDPVSVSGSFVALFGSLAPDGAVLKIAAATPRLLQHTGPAVVFDDYEDMLATIDDPKLGITPDNVLVLRGYGPRGDDGFPEWGMIPIPSYLSARGVTDMVRISDSRMSGTSFGTCVLHIAPDAASGGPLAYLATGDIVTLDTAARTLDVVDVAEVWGARVERWAPAPSRHRRGWPRLYREHVLQAPQGADFDVLRPRCADDLPFREPLIGRS